jgi:hypothetical protein
MRHGQRHYLLLDWGHAPDLFARMAGGSGLVIDVRPGDRIEEKDAEAFEITRDACGLAGWGFGRASRIRC